MHSYYEINPNTGILLYTNGHRILSRARTGEQFGRSVLLSTDYADSLSSTVYDHSLYYIYRNDQRSILLKNITGLQTLYSLPEESGSFYTAPKLCSVGEQLLILYLKENENDHSYCLEYRLPYLTDRRLPDFPSDQSFPSKPEYAVSAFHDSAVLTVRCSGSSAYYLLSPDLTVKELHQADDKNSVQDQEQLITEKYNILIAAMRLEHDNAQQALKNEMDAQQEQIRRLQQEISRQQAVIRSASNQYNDLMKVANTYKEEALKRYGKSRK